MALTKNVADRIHQVTDAFTNWYIVEDGPGGKLIIVDTGLPRSWGSLEKALRQLGRQKTDVEAIVLTHAHFDHMGFARKAQQELGVPIWAHEKEVPLVRNPWGYDHEQPRSKYFVRYPRFAAIFTVMGLNGALFVKGTDNVKTYGSDGVLDVPGKPKIVFTPGHTYGHCALHFPDRGAVIAGDTVVTFNPYTGKSGPQIVSGAATADSKMNLDSLTALASTGAQTVLTGHGHPWREGAAAIANRAREAGPS